MKRACSDNVDDVIINDVTSKNVFPPLRTNRILDFDANWCKLKVDQRSMVSDGTFSDDVDDVFVHDVTDQKRFSAAANEPDVGFRPELVQIIGRHRFYQCP